jgi:hypothetical protein
MAVVAQVVSGMANAATSVAVESDGDVFVGGSAGAAQAGMSASSGFVVRLLANGRFVLGPAPAGWDEETGSQRSPKKGLPLP